MLLYTLMVGASPWLSIPYSDALTLIFPIGIFALYLMEAPSPAKRITKWMLIGMIGYCGYRLKPQCIIIVIAIALLEGIHAVSALIERTASFSFAVDGGAFCAGILICMLLLNLAVAKLPMETDPEEAFGIPHFFKMGLNTERRGGYLREDVKEALNNPSSAGRRIFCPIHAVLEMGNTQSIPTFPELSAETKSSAASSCRINQSFLKFSAIFSTKEERNRNDWIRASERIQQKGVSGLIKQIKAKMQYTYDDGTFFWAGESTFFEGF